MISSVDKDKIPKEYAYVLKTTQLEELINSANIITDVTLIYWKPKIIGSIFEVYFWLPNDRIAYHRLYIRAGAVLKKDVPLAREGLQKEVLPKFEQWIKTIEQLPENSTLYRSRHFEAFFYDNHISITID